MAGVCPACLCTGTSYMHANAPGLGCWRSPGQQHMKAVKVLIPRGDTQPASESQRCLRLSAVAGSLQVQQVPLRHHGRAGPFECRAGTGGGGV